MKRHGEEQRLPGLQTYSPHQVSDLVLILSYDYILNSVKMFWISAANTWCSKYRNKALEKRIKTGVHSPGMFRSDGIHMMAIQILPLVSTI